MKMQSETIRNWRMLKRHPLSAEYPDVSGAISENMVEGLKKYGILNDRPVVLYENQVLDGWQMYSACILADVKPRFVRLSKKIAPEMAVQILNDHRRHETPEAAIARIVKRRERVAEARANGKSLRAIAEDENVSERTVRNDLEASGAEGSAPEIKGKDGKTYTKPEREPGDDTEAIKEEKATRNGATWDSGKFEGAFGTLIREIDVLGKLYKAKETPEANGLRRLLREYKEQFHSWRKALVKAAREKH